MTCEKKGLANLYHLMTLALVATDSASSTVFKSDTGFTIAFPAHYRTDQAESTSLKLYIYLTDSTPVDAVTVSTDDSFSAQATLDTVIETYADAITTAYKDLKVLSKDRITLGGYSAFRTVYRGVLPVQYGHDTVRAEKLKVNQTWIIKNARVYTLTYKALARDYNKYLPYAREIMQSFTLT